MSRHGPVFYLNALPTVEDLRDYQFQSLTECTVQQEEVVSKFIDELDLEAPEDDEEEGEEKLKPTRTFNPTLQYFYQCLEHKALEKDNNLPELDETIEDYLKPDRKLFENKKYVSFLPKIFKIKERQKEEKKRRVFWKEMINNEIQENTGVSDKKLEEKLDKHKEEAKKVISMIRPIDDFKEMVNYKYEDLTESAINQMKGIINKLVLESFKGSYYIKAIECLKELREACITQDEVEFFNAFMEEFKANFPKEKFVDLWRLVSDNKITLISNVENNKSPLTEKECKDWLDNINKREVITSTLNDIENLIADID
jgi:ATP-dependent DNA helicase 2 subunit 2